MSGDYEIIRTGPKGQLAGKKRQKGEILSASEAGDISAPVLAALVAEGYIKPLHADDSEKVEHLQAQVDALREMHVELMQSMTGLLKRIEGLSGGDLVKPASADPKPTTAKKATGAKKEAVSPDPASTKPRRRRAAAKKES